MPPPPFQHTFRRIVEPDEFHDAVSGISLRVEFQRRQEAPSTVEQFQSPGWALDFGMAAVATRLSGVLRNGWASFCISMGPGLATWNGREAPAGTIALLPPGAEVAGRTTDGFAWVTAAIPPAVWQQCLALASADESPRELRVTSLPDPILERIRRALLDHRSGLQGTDDVALQAFARDAGTQLTEAFTRVLESAADREPPRFSAKNRSRLARRAEEWMRDHLREPCRVPDLCLALGVSRRELEYAFRMVFDQAPRERLETLRLHSIRRALRKADGTRATVIGIAYGHGISHLGRFATSYRTLFGENPGETLKRHD